MVVPTHDDVQKALQLIYAMRESLERMEVIFNPTPANAKRDELDPGNPLNKDGQFLTKRGIEVCYRLFDMGKTRYAVKEALKISYGAATHRYHAWEKLGGKNRERQPLD